MDYLPGILLPSSKSNMNNYLTFCAGVVCSVTQSALLFVMLWTVASQVPLSMGFSWQEYWTGFPFPPPRDLPDPGIKLTSAVSTPILLK